MINKTFKKNKIKERLTKNKYAKTKARQ